MTKREAHGTYPWAYFFVEISLTVDLSFICSTISEDRNPLSSLEKNMINDGQIKIRLVIYQPDPRRQKNYCTVVMADQIVQGEWYVAERTMPASELPTFKENFRWAGATRGFEFCDKPPLVPKPPT